MFSAFPTSNFFDIDGGSGFDTLRAEGSNLSFNFSSIRSSSTSSIEAIDLTGSGNSELILGALHLFQISEDTAGGLTRLTVYGDAGDSVSTLDSGWSAIGTTSVEGSSFNIFKEAMPS